LKLVFTVTNDLSYDQRMQRICSSLAANGDDVLLIGRKKTKSIALKEQSFRQKRLTSWFQKGPGLYIEYNFRLFFYLLFCKMDVICAIDLDTILPCYFVSLLRNKKRVYDAHELFTEMKEIVSRPLILKWWMTVERFAVPKFKNGYTVNQSLVDELNRRYGVSYGVVRNMPVVEKSKVKSKKSKEESDGGGMRDDGGEMTGAAEKSTVDSWQMTGTPEERTVDSWQMTGTPEEMRGDSSQMPGTQEELRGDGLEVTVMPIIIYQGAVNEGRSFETLIPAMREVNAKLLICGEGNFFEQTRSLIREYKVENRVLLRGYVAPDELKSITPTARIAVMLFEATGMNQYHSLSNRFFDYIMAGVPQVCVNYPEYKAINDLYDIALMIDDTNPKTIADAFNTLLTDESLHNQLRDNCLIARETLNWSSEEKKLIQFYQQLLNDKKYKRSAKAD
jgi:glycosyltransferase involved in cell wall biosynthesis